MRITAVVDKIKSTQIWKYDMKIDVSLGKDKQYPLSIKISLSMVTSQCEIIIGILRGKGEKLVFFIEIFMVLFVPGLNQKSIGLQWTRKDIGTSVYHVQSNKTGWDVK